MKMSRAVAVLGAFLILGCTHTQGNIRTMQSQYGRRRSQSMLQQRDDTGYVTQGEFDTFASSIQAKIDTILNELQKLSSTAQKDNCANSPCVNQGTCLNRLNGYECLCKPGYGGANCEHHEGLGISKVLTVDNGQVWGSWAIEDTCPSGSFARNFRINLEAALSDGDDTAMNNIELTCRDAVTGHDTRTIRSGQSNFGTWRQWQNCPNGEFLTGFSMKVEAHTDDDTAANGVTMTCSGGSKLTGPIGAWGSFGSTANCPANHAICGVKTKIEPYQEDGDDTALNDIVMLCCAWW